MRFRINLLLLFLLLMVKEGIYAQTQQLKFNEVNGINGVTLGKINSIVRDIHGVMWLSDQTYRSIIRYDGSRMTKFQNDPKNPNSLGGYYPECLFADSSGKIWIGFYGMGLDRFDPETGIFNHYRHQQNDPSSLANDSVTSILVDHLGNIWVGNYSGLDLLDPQTGKFKHYSHKEQDPASLSSNKIRALYEDHQGDLWIGTGLNWENNSEGGLNRFNRQTGTFTRFLNDPQNPQSLINNKVRAIFEDSRGTFWVGTAGDGLHTMDRKTGLFTRYTYDPAHADKLSRPPLFNAEDNITFITEDAEKEIWIGSLWSGLTRYNTVTKKITHYGSVTDSSGGYKNNSSWWANTSTDGLIWISTQSTVSATLYMADLYTNYIPAYVMGKDFVDGVYRVSAIVWWFATDSGLVRLDTSKGTSVRSIHDYDVEKCLKNNIY